MTKKEQQQYDNELDKSVRALMGAIRLIAGKKAAQYEIDLLTKVRDKLNDEIDCRQFVEKAITESVVNEIEQNAKE